MKKQITLFILLSINIVCAFGHNYEQTDTKKVDSLVKHSSIYFMTDKIYPEGNEYRKLNTILKWAKSDSSSVILIHSWVDKWGGNSKWNRSLSHHRAKGVCDFLIRNGIDSTRVFFESKGIDSLVNNTALARRADIYELFTITKTHKQPILPKPQPKVEPKIEIEPIPKVVLTPIPVVKVISTPKVEPKIEIEPEPKLSFFEKSEQFAKSMYEISLRANMLRWATTTMNLGVEVRPISSVGIVLDFDYAPFVWGDALHGYRKFNFQPQVRYYFGKDYNFYAGGEFHVGNLNWKLETKGHQGDFIGGGAVIGYKLQLNKRFNIDFSLSAGYTRYKYDKYMDVDGKQFAYAPNQRKDYWGLTSVGVTLVWKVFKVNK